MYGAINLHHYLNVDRVLASEHCCSNTDLFIFAGSFPVWDDAVLLTTAATSCQGRCGNLMESVRCRCDYECELFGDCCYDYNHHCHNQRNFTNNEYFVEPESYSCFPLHDENPSIGSVLLVNTCTSNWTDTYLDDLCKGTNPDTHRIPKQRFPFEWPVADQSGINFRNVFCAICNDRVFWSISPWDIPRRPHYHRDGDQCHELSIFGEVGQRLRYCYPEFISTCPDTFGNRSIVSLCKLHFGCFISDDIEIYKNYYCAICNGVDFVEMSIKPCSEGVLGQGTASLRQLWSFSETLAELPVHHPQCSERNNIYDPYTRRCRPITCSPGFELDHRGKCVITPARSGSIDGLCCEQQQAWIFLGFDRYDTGVKNAENQSCLMEKLNFSSIGQNMKWTKRQYDGYVITELLQNNETCNIVSDLDEIFLQTNDIFRLCQPHDVSYIYMCDTFAAQNHCDGVWFHGEAQDFSLADGPHVAQILQHKKEFIMPKFVLHQVSYSFDSLFNTFVKKEHVSVCGTYVNHLQSDCPLITLQNGDYHISVTANGTRILHVGTLTVDENDFIIYPNGLVQLCVDTLSAFTVMNHGLNLANIIGSTLSLLGLFVTFGLFCRYKTLRNVHGIFLMNLCIALFVAQLLSLITSQVAVSSTTLCTMMAVTAHYFWLASFTWTSIIAINLFRVFTRTRVQNENLRVDTNYGSRYIVPGCGWGIPFLVVLACGIVHFVIDSFPIYSETFPCWMASPTSNLLAFGVPVGVAQVINIGLFMITVVVACYKQRRSRQLQMREQTLGAFMADFCLSMKVCANSIIIYYNLHYNKLILIVA